MEYWDLYNFDGTKKKKKAIRGSKLDNNEYHLVVNAWIVNNQGEYLITQRSASKSHPLMWECTGGSANAKETSIQAAIREVKEELGIEVLEKDATFIGSTRRFYKNCPDILEVWLFKSNVSLNEVKIQKEEVNNVIWASKDKIMQLFIEGKFEANAFFNRIVNSYNNHKVYYIGFNANNAICNENFIDGSLTINPNNEIGNIYYTKQNIKNRDNMFLSDYKEFLIKNMNNLVNKYDNVVFLAFNDKIKKMLSDTNTFNIIYETNNELIKNLNDKKYTRDLLKDKLPVINTLWIDKNISYKEIKRMIDSEVFVLQGRNGSGGNDTYLIDTEDKFNRYKSVCNNLYFISKYIKHLPVNITIVIGKYDVVKLPLSIQLIKLNNDKFNYVGGDFIYSQKLDSKVINTINNYTDIIIKELKNLNYQGILGIDYIIDDNDNVYFMEINPRYQASSFIISKYLNKYCSTSLAELHYLAINNLYLGNNYLEKIDNSFLNCYQVKDYNEFKFYKRINNGYYSKNKSSYFRKVFDYSILKHGEFEKREKDK